MMYLCILKETIKFHNWHPAKMILNSFICVWFDQMDAVINVVFIQVAY